MIDKSIYEKLYDIATRNLRSRKSFSLSREVFSKATSMEGGILDVFSISSLAGQDFMLAAYWGIFQEIPGTIEAVKLAALMKNKGRGAMLEAIVTSERYAKEGYVVLQNNIYE